MSNADIANLIFVGVLAWLLPAYLAYRIGESKERDSGLVWGLVLGWVGVLIVLALPRHGQVCPECAETVRSHARTCRYCGARLRLEHLG